MIDRQAVFLDTGYAIALANPDDQHRGVALRLADELRALPRRVVTTRAVLLEIGNALASPQHRAIAVQILNALERDVDVVEIDRTLYAEGLARFTVRPDKQWTLTDCLSFVVMESRTITDALAYDKHFEQAGFLALMRATA